VLVKNSITCNGCDYRDFKSSFKALFVENMPIINEK
jgi:hypothetical protein